MEALQFEQGEVLHREVGFVSVVVSERVDRQLDDPVELEGQRVGAPLFSTQPSRFSASWRRHHAESSQELIVVTSRSVSASGCRLVISLPW